MSAATIAHAAKKELAERILSQRRFMPFVKRMNPKYLDGWVHNDIAERLERFSKDVAAGLSPRLMLLVPPRHGKSELASKNFPAWHLGHYPDHEFISCSYNVSLAMGFSRKVQQIMDDQSYKSLFPTRLDPNNRSAESWGLSGSAGGYVAAGIGGAITGKGAHVLVIDDPIKNAEEADSPDAREKIWEWYLSTAYSRLAPGGGVLIIQTWWHDDDLAGKVQQVMADARKEAAANDEAVDDDVDFFDVVKYPAIATDDEYLDEDSREIVYNECPTHGRLLRRRGEALHAARYDLKKLSRIRRQHRKSDGSDGRWWSALYQQNPVPEDGDYFTKDQFHTAELPSITRCHVFQTWDFAIGAKKLNDWIVGTTTYQDEHDTLHVAEVKRFKSNDTLKIIDEIIDMAWRHDHPSLILGFEDGQIWKTMKSVLLKRMAERVKKGTARYVSFEELNPLTDKMVRARPLQGRMQQGTVSFKRGASWYDDCRAELLRFPAGAHDDQVDSLAWNVILAQGKQPPQRAVAKPIKSWRTRLEALANAQSTGGTSAMAS